MLETADDPRAALDGLPINRRLVNASLRSTLLRGTVRADFAEERAHARLRLYSRSGSVSSYFQCSQHVRPRPLRCRILRIQLEGFVEALDCTLVVTLSTQNQAHVQVSLIDVLDSELDRSALESLRFGVSTLLRQHRPKKDQARRRFRVCFDRLSIPAFGCLKIPFLPEEVTHVHVGVESLTRQNQLDRSNEGFAPERTARRSESASPQRRPLRQLDEVPALAPQLRDRPLRAPKQEDRQIAFVRHAVGRRHGRDPLHLLPGFEQILLRTA